jgi:hypothetical protein
MYMLSRKTLFFSPHSHARIKEQRRVVYTSAGSIVIAITATLFAHYLKPAGDGGKAASPSKKRRKVRNGGRKTRIRRHKGLLGPTRLKRYITL